MAEWEKQQTITIAEWKLTEKQKEAEWIKAVWLAQAETEKAMQMAPVEAQIALAQQIWSNEWYMNYLLWLKWFDVSQVVWTEKAKALQSADLKVISTSWSPNDGVDNIMDLFGSKWGIAIANWLEMLQQTEWWKALFEKLIWNKFDSKKMDKEFILNNSGNEWIDWQNELFKDVKNIISK
jgi:flotillin